MVYMDYAGDPGPTREEIAADAKDRALQKQARDRASFHEGQYFHFLSEQINDLGANKDLYTKQQLHDLRLKVEANTTKADRDLVRAFVGHIMVPAQRERNKTKAAFSEKDFLKTLEEKIAATDETTHPGAKRIFTELRDMVRKDLDITLPAEQQEASKNYDAKLAKESQEPNHWGRHTINYLGESANLGYRSIAYGLLPSIGNGGAWLIGEGTPFTIEDPTGVQAHAQTAARRTPPAAAAPTAHAQPGASAPASGHGAPSSEVAAGGSGAEGNGDQLSEDRRKLREESYKQADAQLKKELREKIILERKLADTTDEEKKIVDAAVEEEVAKIAPGAWQAKKITKALGTEAGNKLIHSLPFNARKPYIESETAIAQGIFTADTAEAQAKGAKADAVQKTEQARVAADVANAQLATAQADAALKKATTAASTANLADLSARRAAKDPTLSPLELETLARAEAGQADAALKKATTAASTANLGDLKARRAANDPTLTPLELKTLADAETAAANSKYAEEMALANLNKTKIDIQNTQLNMIATQQNIAITNWAMGLIGNFGRGGHLNLRNVLFSDNIGGPGSLLDVSPNTSNTFMQNFGTPQQALPKAATPAEEEPKLAPEGIPTSSRRAPARSILMSSTAVDVVPKAAELLKPAQNDQKAEELQKVAKHKAPTLTA